MTTFTQDEIIEMARQAGLYQDINVSFHQALRNFYDLATERTWVGLTGEEIEILFQTAAGADEEVHIRFARAIESKLKDKNS